MYNDSQIYRDVYKMHEHKVMFVMFVYAGAVWCGGGGSGDDVDDDVSTMEMGWL